MAQRRHYQAGAFVYYNRWEQLSTAAYVPCREVSMATPTIDVTMTEFLDLMHVASPQTAATYRVGLRYFVTYLENRHHVTGATPVSEVLTDWLLPFPAWLQRTIQKRSKNPAREVNPATLRTYLTGVLSWYAYVVGEGGWVPNVTMDNYYRVRKRMYAAAKAEDHILLKRLPSEDAVERLLVVVRTPLPPLPAGSAVTPETEQRRHLVWLRDRAIVECLMTSGLRVAELTALRYADLLAEQHGAEIQGKGKKHRVVLFSLRAWDSLQEYLQVRDHGRNQPETPVFARHNPQQKEPGVQPITSRSIQRTFRDLAAQAGLARLTPHQLRHYYATVLLRLSGNLALVQDALGHQSADTTRRYAQVALEDLQREHARIFDGAEPVPPATPAAFHEQAGALPGDSWPEEADDEDAAEML